jgi:hypothetical protein
MMKLSYFELMTVIHPIAEDNSIHTIDELIEHLQDNQDLQIEFVTLDM